MKNFFWSFSSKKLRAYGSIQKVATALGDYTTVCLLDSNYFKDDYKMIEIDLSKQQALYADPKAMQEISFTGNLQKHGNENTAMFFLLLKNPKKLF